MQPVRVGLPAGSPLGLPDHFAGAGPYVQGSVADLALDALLQLGEEVAAMIAVVAEATARSDTAHGTVEQIHQPARAVCVREPL